MDLSKNIDFYSTWGARPEPQGWPGAEAGLAWDRPGAGLGPAWVWPGVGRDSGQVPQVLQKSMLLERSMDFLKTPTDKAVLYG